MRIWLAVLALSASAASAQPPLVPTPKTLWSGGNGEVRQLQCQPGYSGCGAIQIVQDGKVLKQTDYFEEATIEVNWKKAPGQQGPDVVFNGGGGGSLGDVDMLSVTFSNPAVIQELVWDHSWDINFHTDGGSPAFDLTYSLMDFQGEANGGTASVPIPMHWSGSKFEVDFAKLSSVAAKADIARMTAELGAKPAGRGPLPNTVQAMLVLVLAGEADRAQAELAKAWRGVTSERDHLWNKICGRIVTEEKWAALGLDRLPHADLIRASAGKIPASELTPE
jgi:hypothetical protein